MKYSSNKKSIHLCEINHFYCKHPGAIAFSKELQRRFPGELVAYQPYAEWDLSAKLPHVIHRFSLSGFSSLVSPSPSDENIKAAIKWVDEHEDAISGFSIERPNLRLQFNGIPLGYLLTELFPQYFDSFELSKDQVRYGLIQAISRIEFWVSFFERFNVVSIIFSHAVYDFGFPVLVARTRGIPAYSVNENHVYRFDFQPSSLLEDNRLVPYDILFNTLQPDLKSDVRSEATNQLNQRLFKGVTTGLLRTDPRAMREATVSSDALSSLFIDSNRKRVVFLTHALSDAPYSSTSIDSDFCTPLLTLTTIFELTKDLEIDFFVKDHPKPFQRDRSELLKIASNYPHVRLLPSETTLIQLKDIGVDLIITGWGTCIMEAGFLEIPVVAYTDFSVASSFGLEHIASSPSHLRGFLMNSSLWTARSTKEQAIDAFGATDVMRTVDWCGIDFVRLNQEFGNDGGYVPAFYDYWEQHKSIERDHSMRMRIQRYLDSKLQWLSLLHL